MASILTKIFSSISNNNSSSSSSSKKRSSGEISSSLTKEQINMWVEASKNVNNLKILVLGGKGIDSQMKLLDSADNLIDKSLKSSNFSFFS